MDSSDVRNKEMGRLQAQVKPETQTWLKLESVRRGVTIGEVIDQIVDLAQKQGEPTDQHENKEGDHKNG
jgi:hypothetical protein